MDLKQIEKLMTAMEQSRIKRIVLKKEDYEIEIERECAASGAEAFHYTPTVTYAQPPVPVAEPRPAAPQGFPVAQEAASGKKEDTSGSLFVTSPMVGTFYASPSPEDPAFVKPGDSVTENSVVCIIEAMKVMNEVKAGVKGTVAEVLIKNGEPVEFGTQIIRVNPA